MALREGSVRSRVEWPAFRGSWGAFAARFERADVHAIIFQFDTTPFSRIKKAFGIARSFGIACVADRSTGTVQFQEISDPRPRAVTSRAGIAFGSWNIGAERVTTGLFEGVVRAPIRISNIRELGPWGATDFYPHCTIESSLYGCGTGFIEIGSSSLLPRNMASMPCRWFYMLFQDGRVCALWQLGEHWYGFFTDGDGTVTALCDTDIVMGEESVWKSAGTHVRYLVSAALRIDRVGLQGRIDLDAARDREHVSDRLVSGRMFFSTGTYAGSPAMAVVHAGMIGEETRPWARAYIACGNFLFALTNR